MGPRTVESNERLLGGFLKYPSLRDEPLKSAALWLRGKKIDDNYGSLWRVHDKLYDLVDFIERHPGGAVWIQMTRGTDITEAFETSHPSPHVEKILAKYLVKMADGPRNSPYTFEPDGFYKTLKQKVYAKLQSLPPQLREQGRNRVIRIQNVILMALVSLLALTIHFQSSWLAFLTGTVLFFNINCAHNFYHQRDNWRMYAWDLGLLSSHEWRITHALSHHIYTNTLYDYELSGFEPLFNFKVESKGFFERFGIYVFGHFLYPLFFFSDFVKRSILIAKGLQPLRPENLLPLAELLLLIIGTSSLLTGLRLWLTIQAVASYWFGFVGIIVAHHHPNLYHAGDEFALGHDWGLCQMDAVRDRREVNDHLFAVLISYGNHVLHHLFPTVDHGVLPLVQDEFIETCHQFGIKDVDEFQHRYSQWDLLSGAFRQLSRVQPRDKIKST